MKTHRYFSFSDICLIRDYLKIKVDEATEIPDNLQERFEYLKKLVEKYGIRKEKDIKEEICQIFNDSELIYDKFHYEHKVEVCKQMLSGYFIPKSKSLVMSSQLKEAKRYFQTKSK